MKKNKEKKVSKFNSFFGISARKTTIKTEIMAGFTTFLAMAYILIVNPNNILSNGSADPRFASVFIATALGAFIGTLLMALVAKMPIAQAPGMGINALVGTIIGGAAGFSFSYGNAMAMIFISGFIFCILSFVPGGKNKDGELISFRERVFDAMPKPIITSISVGVGLFIAFVGLQNAKIITSNEFTLVSLIKFNTLEAWTNGGPACSAVVALFGLMVIGVLHHYKVKGSVFYGIVASTLLSIPLGVADLNVLAGRVDGISWKFWENISDFFRGENTVFLSLFNGGFNFPDKSIMTSIMLMVSLCMVDMFDTVGTVIGCSKNAGLVDENNKPLNYNKIMYTDSLSSVLGSVIGTSTVTAYVESSTGVADGGRTGLTALSTAVLFLLSIFLLPLFAFIPSAAASSALIYVGVLMMKNVLEVDFENIKNAIPSFLTIIVMLLSYSITNGVGIGIISFVILDYIIFIVDLIKGKKAKLETTWVTLIVFILFLFYYLVPTII